MGSPRRLNARQDYPKSVFINCPFDADYQPLFNAMVFAICDSGFRPRCGWEIDDGTQTRIDKILDLIEDCRLGIHDLSRVEVTSATNLPRFNMPLELGMFLAAKRFGSWQRQKQKTCLIFDREKHRYQKFISDIAGQDIQVHKGEPRTLITRVRNWLQAVPPIDDAPTPHIPGGASIFRRYTQFLADLGELCKVFRLEPSELTFLDRTNLIEYWLLENADAV